MAKGKIIILTTLALLGIQGCKWNDDFRAREQPTYLQQPQYLEPPPRPTLNRESEDYRGDDTNKTEEDEKNTHMPEIDTPIPPIQEYPPGL